MNSPVSDQSKALLIRYEKSLDCVHCGLCLTHCPTYDVTGNEALSPRGRIHLMKGLAEGRFELTPGFRDKMETCLSCRACESVCPSGVEFGRMMEITREEMQRKPKGKWLRRWWAARMLRKVIPDHERLEKFMRQLEFANRWGLMSFARGLSRVRLLPRGIRAMVDNLPDLPPAEERGALPAQREAQGSPARGEVALLEGCVMRPLFGAVNRATVDALSAQGYGVKVPQLQTCCGALHAHQGDLETARKLARQNLEAFASCSQLIVNSAGCGAAIKDYEHWFSDDKKLVSAARALAAKTVDISVFFEREGLVPRGQSARADIKAAYDAPCHLHHAQGCTAEPEALLRRIPNLHLVPLEGSQDCCGGAGVYNLLQPDLSSRILERKLDQLEASGARILITGNPGCMLQWRKGIRDRGLKIEVVHPAELL
ncbi:MAG: heterodisulfide reductase-related iron-sulfur binding cluster [Planctomycetota bacterium]